MQITFDISDVDYVHADKVILLLKWLRGGYRELPTNLARHLELVEWLEDIHDDIEANLDNYDWKNAPYKPNTKVRRYSIRHNEGE